MDSNRSYRIRTEVGQNSPNVLNVKIDNSFDILEILSLKLDQENLYHLPKSNYGVIVGRVIANKGFGVPNAKISIFIPRENDENLKTLYSYATPFSRGDDGIRYNLLPSIVNDECHQDVGTFFTKKELLDNSTIIEIFEKYYRYTTTTNNSGDFLLSGVPTGMQQVHMDLDMSDCGVLSQTPRDMIYKGYNINQFESNVQFKKSTNLNNLAQIFTQNKSIYVYPFWGDTTDEDTNTSITRCDIEIDYEFEPTCIFMGSVVTDTAEASLSRKCQPDVNLGKMSNMVTGEGTIEMIRRTPDGKVEEYSVKGEKLIDGNGVWCYQIPMNLDYVTTDEFGNLVASDNPNKGIATRTRVRFRISMMDIEGDAIARKRAKYLVPNNPIVDDESNPEFNRTHKFDYEFGTYTADENFRDLYWNKVYTVKSYIPRLQKKSSPDKKNYTAIKAVNHYGDNNPMPYNNIQIKFNFMYRFVCTLIRFILIIISILNRIISPFATTMFKAGQVLFFVGSMFKPNERVCTNMPDYTIDESGDGQNGEINEDIEDNDRNKSRLRIVGCLLMHAALDLGIPFKNDLCEEIGGYNAEFYPGISKKFYYLKTGQYSSTGDNLISKINSDSSNKWGSCCNERGYLNNKLAPNNIYTDLSGIMNCIENSLAVENEVISFNFHNDWVNGVLYFPLWMRTIKQKKNGKVKDTYCNYNLSDKYKLKIYHPCAPWWGNQTYELNDLQAEDNNLIKRKIEKNTKIGRGYSGSTQYESNGYRFKSHRKTIGIMKVDNGLIVEKETKLGQYVYYYSCGEYFNGTTNDDFHTKNKSEVKLFATDIVLLGSLDKCDPDGIPQFFEQLPSTTYNMPPALLTLDYETDDSISSDDNSTDDINDVIKEGIVTKTLHTEYTGADWGDSSLDIFYRNKWNDTEETNWISSLKNNPPNDNDIDEVYSNENIVSKLKQDLNSGETKAISIPIVPGGEKFDRGGLFYGITCNASYVKPKSCINLMRQCEFGVTLDQSKNLPNRTDDDVDGILLLPDGFISYDEITNHDGRSMFATMNYDLLRYKIDENTGYKKVDFRHRYIDNFDGTLKNLMAQIPGNYNPQHSTNPPIRNYIDNYKLELRSEDYVKFRYKGNPYHYRVGGNYLGHVVGHRIPRYRNSFYFYFGLKEGKTAIDRFRSEYYGTCENRNNPKYSLSPEYIPNTWCNDRTEFADGYFALYIKSAVLPYSVDFENLDSSDPDDSFTITDLYDEKIYISNQSKTDLEDAGYVRQYNENNIPRVLNNGHYIVTIIDGDGIINDFEIVYMPSSINGNASSIGFNKTNDELYEDPNVTYCIVAEEITNYERTIGGYISITNLSPNRDTTYKVMVTPTNPDDFPQNDPRGLYGGFSDIFRTDSDILWGRSGYATGCGKLYYNNSTYEVGVTVPKGGVNYDIEIIMLCDLQETNNRFKKTIFVPEGSESRMLVSNVEYDVIGDFKAGVNSNGGFNGERYIKGWCDIDNLSFKYDISNPDDYNYNTDNPNDIFGYFTPEGVVREKLIHNVTTEDDGATINEQIRLLSTAKVEGSVSPYRWPKEYRISILDLPITINTYDHIPTLSEQYQITAAYIYYNTIVTTYAQCEEPQNYVFGNNNTFPNLLAMQTSRSLHTYCRVGVEDDYVYYEFTNTPRNYFCVRDTSTATSPDDPIYQIIPGISDYRQYADFDYELYYNNMTANERLVWVEIINNIVNMRQDVVVKMKDAFWIQDYDHDSDEINGGNELLVTPVGDDVPYTGVIKYSDYNDNMTLPPPRPTEYTQVYHSMHERKGNIWYPLISYDNEHVFVWNNKLPFAVGMKCGNGMKIPRSISPSTYIETIDKEKILTEFFNLLYIDKKFEFDDVCWGATEELSGNDLYKIWDYDARSTNNQQYPITKNAIFAIRIENGIINGDVEDDGSVKFIEQSLTRMNIPMQFKIYNFKHSEGVFDTEMRMPTRRTTKIDWELLNTPANINADSNTNPTLNNYRVWNDNTTELQAITLPRVSLIYNMSFTHHYNGEEITIADLFVPHLKVKVDDTIIVKNRQISGSYNTGDIVDMNDLEGCLIKPSVNVNRNVTFYLMLHEYDYARVEDNGEDHNKDKYCVKHPYIDHYKHFNDSTDCKYDDNFTANDYFGDVIKPQNRFMYMTERDGFWFNDENSGIVVENNNGITVVDNGMSANANIINPLILATCTNDEVFDLKEVFGYNTNFPTFSLPGTSSHALESRVCSSSLMYVIAKDNNGNTLATSPLIDMVDWQAQLVIYNGIEDNYNLSDANSWGLDTTLKKIVLRIHRPSKSTDTNSSHIPCDTYGNSLRYYYPFTKSITISPSKDETQYYFTVDPTQCSKQFINKDENGIPRWWEITLYEDGIYTSEGITFGDDMTMEDIIDKWKSDYNDNNRSKCNIFFKDIVGVSHYCEEFYVRCSRYYMPTVGGSWGNIPVVGRMWGDTFNYMFNDGSTTPVTENYSITVECNDSTMGSVAITGYKEPGSTTLIPCNYLTHSFKNNTVVEITATPTSGHQLLEWDDNGTYKNRPVRYINLCNDLTFTAIFE